MLHATKLKPSSPAPRRRSILWQFARFVGVGALATGIQYAILIALRELDWCGPVLASAIGFCVSALMNYLMNYYFTFGSSAAHVVAGFRFAVVSSIGLGLNSAVMYLFTSINGVHYLLAQVAATGVVMLWNFSAHRMWTYRDERA